MSEQAFLDSDLGLNGGRSQFLSRKEIAFHLTPTRKPSAFDGELGSLNRRCNHLLEWPGASIRISTWKNKDVLVFMGGLTETTKATKYSEQGFWNFCRGSSLRPSIFTATLTHVMRLTPVQVSLPVLQSHFLFVV